MKKLPVSTIKSHGKVKPVVAPVQPVDDPFEFHVPKQRISPFKVDLPAERIWLTAAVTEQSDVFLSWLRECQTLVDAHFGIGIFALNVKPIKNYLWITMQSKDETRAFAFIAKSTGDIHCPAVFDEPFDCAHGNITDALTRLDSMGAWGVKTTMSWLPTYPNGRHFRMLRV
jgi:hypothetical protein